MVLIISKASALIDNALVKQRFLGIQANTSELPYDKLDGSRKLKTSSPNYLAECIMRLQSVHYLIRDKESGLCIEVQVRTLFEEAWSEIDHKLRYPYN